MPWGAAAAATAAVAGSYLSGQAAKSAASTSADAQRYAADQAAQAARFTPVGVKTNLGESNFTFNPDGTIASAGYTLDPRLQAPQDTLFGQLDAAGSQRLQQAAEPLYGAASGLFSLGSDYIATSPQQAAQDYYNSQQGLLSSSRAADDARLGSLNFGRGTGGLGVQTGTGNAPANPLAQAMYNARAQQDMTLAAQADQYGMQRTAYGADLYNRGAGLLGQISPLTVAGYSPLTTQLGLIGSIEGMGQQPFDLSTALGARQSTAGANVGSALLQGGVAAARTQQAGNQYSLGGAALQGLSQNPNLQSWFGSQIKSPLDSWQTSGDPTYFGSNSYQSSEGYSGMNAELGL